MTCIGNTRLDYSILYQAIRGNTLELLNLKNNQRDRNGQGEYFKNI